MHTFTARLATAWMAAAALVTLSARAEVVVWDQSAFGLAPGFNVSTQLSLNDFQLDAATAVGGLRVWLTEGRVEFGGNGVADGHFESFSGLLAWSLWTDVAGAPGAIEASGDNGPVGIVDTGLNTVVLLGEDIFEVTVWFDAPVLLAAGRHWLGLREGPAGMPDDGSELLWSPVQPPTLGTGQFWFDDGQHRTGLNGPSQGEAAFQLLGATDLPTPGSLALSTVGLLAYGWTRRRRPGG